MSFGLRGEIDTELEGLGWGLCDLGFQVGGFLLLQTAPKQGKISPYSRKPGLAQPVASCPLLWLLTRRGVHEEGPGLYFAVLCPEN